MVALQDLQNIRFVDRSMPICGGSPVSLITVPSILSTVPVGTKEVVFWSKK